MAGQQYSSINLDKVVVIDDWPALDEELAGSRAKRTVAEPETDTLYVFKEPKERREAQIWSELIASFIAGDLLGWSVQYAQIATKNGKIGNLLRYVFDPSAHFLLAGERFCTHVDPEFDPKQGKRHTWELITQLKSAPLLELMSEDGYFHFWAKVIAFDTLISNTDRHAENWAVLATPPGEGAIQAEMAPLFDNASSMGCEIEEKGLRKWFSADGSIAQSKVAQYVNGGRHHLRMQVDGGRCKFEELAQMFICSFPTYRPVYMAIAELDLARLEPMFEQIMNLQDVPAKARMTPERQTQITRLLREGQMRIIRTLDHQC